MTNKKTTKRALLASVLALFLCFSMLLGTTYAWFTDSVTSSANIIKSGKLDIKMSYLAPQTDSSSGRVWENFSYYYAYPDDAQWVDVESANAQPIFNYQKWEPGYTDCAYLMIENEGNLNLQYCLKVVPTGEVGKLAEVIDVYYQVYYQATKDSWSYKKGDWLNANHQKATPDNIWYDDMTTGSKYAGTLQDIIDGKFTLANDQMLYPNDYTGSAMFNNIPQGRVYYAIALHMREDAGNVYQNQSIGDAFDVRLLATQAIGEQDMYSNDYDAKAEYPTIVSSSADLKAAIAAGETNLQLLPGEYDVDLYNVNAGDTLTINGTGPDTKIAFSNLQVRASQFNEVIISNCTIERMPDKNWGHLVFGSSTTPGGVYTISNCTFNGVGSQGIYINQNVAATFNIENCTFNGDFGSEGAITIQNNDGVDITVNVTGCTFNNIPATSHEIFVHYAYDGWTLNAEGVNAYWKANP